MLTFSHQLKKKTEMEKKVRRREPDALGEDEMSEGGEEEEKKSK